MSKSKGIALLVGLTHVDPAAYGGWNGINGCAGCALDVEAMAAIAGRAGFEVRTLLTEHATKSAVLSGLTRAANDTGPDDLFFFYYSGHGGQQPDLNGDETDGQDETLVAYDGQIIDDDLNGRWLSFKAGVRIFMASDSCNSGTNYRLMGSNLVIPTPILAVPDRKTASEIKAQMIHFGGCKDGATSDGYATGGAFTTALVNAWRGGKFSGSYRDLYMAVLAGTTTGQVPQYNEYGAVSAAFRAQKPFVIGGDQQDPKSRGGTGPTGGREVSVGVNITIRAASIEDAKRFIEEGLPGCIKGGIDESSKHRDGRPCSVSANAGYSTGGGVSAGGSLVCTF